MLSILMIGLHSVPFTPPPTTNIVKLEKSLGLFGTVVVDAPLFVRLKSENGIVTVTHLLPVSYEPVVVQGR